MKNKPPKYSSLISDMKEKRGLLNGTEVETRPDS